MEKWRNVAKRQEIYLPLLVPGNKVCVFDTETTGLDAKENDVIQFSAALYRIQESELKMINIFDTFIYNECIPDKITEITGITNEDVKKAPKLQDIFPKIKFMLESADVWMGYNINFDVSFLENMAKKVNDTITSKPLVDVMEIARDMCPPELNRTNLRSVTRWLNGGNYKFHNSLDDVKATAFCFSKLYKFYSISYNPDGNLKTLLKKAYYWKNPRRNGQERIKLILSDGQPGDIFYDMLKHCWSCKETESSKRLYKKLNKRDLEEQFMNKYGFKYGRKTPDEVAYSFRDFVRKKEEGII